MEVTYKFEYECGSLRNNEWNKGDCCPKRRGRHRLTIEKRSERGKGEQVYGDHPLLQVPYLNPHLLPLNHFWFYTRLDFRPRHTSNASSRCLAGMQVWATTRELLFSISFFGFGVFPGTWFGI